MTNKELAVILRLRDELSAKIKGVERNLQSFANKAKKHWLEIASAVYAAKKAFDWAEMGANAEQTMFAFNNLAQSVGFDADQMISDLKRLSGQTLSTTEAIKQASAAVVLGINADQIPKLMEIARASARAFGEDVDFMFESIVKGIGRQSKLVLDNLGIVFNANEAYEEYAEKLGKTAKELTDAEKRQAFLNKTIEEGESILRKINTEMQTNYERIQMMKARWQDFTESAGMVFLRIFEVIKASFQAFAGMFIMILSGLATAFRNLLIVPALKFVELLGKLPGAAGEAFDGIAAKLSTLNEQFKIAYEEGLAGGALEAMEDMDESLNYAFMSMQEKANEMSVVIRKSFSDIGDEADDLKSNLDEAKHKMEEEFAKQAARNMQNAFSDFFFKTMKGELDTLQDAFVAFGDSVLQIISNILAKIMLIKLFTAAAGVDGQIFGVGVDQLFHQGGMVSKYHQGGAVRPIVAHNGLAPDEVPIIAQTGEGVLSRRGMAALGGSQNLRALNRGDSGGGAVININVPLAVQAWDASDVQRNADVLAMSVAERIAGNAQIRGVIQKYT